MQIAGKLIEKLPIANGVSKTGKNWEKMTFVIQVKDSKFPKQVAFDTLNAEMIRNVSDTSVGADVDVTFDVASREYQGKWYTNVTAWKIEVSRSTDTDDHAGVNQIAQMHNKQYERATVVKTEDDDLPF